MPTNNSINSQDPIQVAKGGTGQSTLTTAFGILAAGTSATAGIQNIGTGSAGQILKSNGSSSLPTFVAPSSVGGSMVLLHTITFNNTAFNYDLTSYVTGYDIYKFIASGVETPTGVNPDISIQFSTNAGTSFITTGYKTQFTYFQGAGGSGSAANVNRIPIVFVNGTAAYLNQGEVMMTGYGGSSGAYIHGTNLTNFSTDSIPQIVGGYYFGSGLNGIRITNNAASNFITGKFSIYGIAT